MSLKAIPQEIVFLLLEKTIISCNLFCNYKLIKTDYKRITKPTVITQYDCYFIFENRKLQVRINDYFKNQTIAIWIDKLDDSNLNRFNLEYYFLDIGIKQIKQKLIFKSNSKNKLKKKIGGILNFIYLNTDDVLKKVLSGEKWIEMPFDWGDYK